MIVPVLRLKLSDFLGTDYEKEVLDRLREINNLDFMPPFEIYLWYDRDNDKVELSRLKDFIVDWESKGDFKSKTIIVPEFFDRPVDFIWYDVIPRKMYDEHYIQYSRFSWVYSDPKTGILEGLDEYIKTFKFTIADRLPRKQKRNDDENSNHR
jgi:hypothetical protein|tara:strand:+ start:178 stop:636 length:459 start_codon:yes stop_codon:yes gene_type:complete